MIKQVDLVSYLPSYLQGYREQVAALKAEDPEFMLIWDGVDKVLYNHFICTADEYGIGRYEKIMGITPEEGDNLESRRSRVMMNWFTQIPYTMKAFVQKLNVLCGAGNYIMSCDFREAYYLKLITHLDNYGEAEELKKLFDDMVPCNIFIDSANDITVSSGNDPSQFAGRPAVHYQFSIAADQP